jgi:hypothetical protein
MYCGRASASPDERHAVRSMVGQARVPPRSARVRGNRRDRSRGRRAQRALLGASPCGQVFGAAASFPQISGGSALSTLGGRSTASDRGPLLSQSSWRVSPLLRTSAAKARAAVATAGGISGSSTSQSFVAREITPRRLRAAPPTTMASKPTPRSSRNTSNRSRRLRESMSISVTDTIFRNKPQHGGLSRDAAGQVDLSTTCLERLVNKWHYRSNGFATNPRKLLIWWPMVTDHPFSSSSILMPEGTENPRVGGSIPSQATKLSAT